MAFIYINSKKFENNVRYFKKIVGIEKICFVLKDNAYGHGLIEVAKLAGLPKEVLQRATTINNQLQAQRKQKLGLNSKSMDSVKSAINQDGDLEIDKLPLFETSAN